MIELVRTDAAGYTALALAAEDEARVGALAARLGLDPLAVARLAVGPGLAAIERATTTTNTTTNTAPSAEETR